MLFSTVLFSVDRTVLKSPVPVLKLVLSYVFSILKRKADPVYSEPLNVNGLSWRLKVYPVSLLLDLSCKIKCEDVKQ